MKKAIVTIIAVTAAVIALRQISQSTPETRIPYYDYH